VSRALRLATSDGLVLEAELAGDDGGDRAARAAAVLCHPHPQYGGTMRSIVVSALFAALPADGVVCLRFNFRGVEGSEGAFDAGTGEQIDVAAAVEALAAAAPGLPLLLAGWSFGADMALSVRAPRVAGWLAIAPPLRYADAIAATASDPRPKWLVLAEHDEIQAPAAVQDEAAGWAATTIEVVGGASHFFVGRTDAVVGAARRAVDQLVARG
jgi:alpha/beta superfamily hydrolase